MRGPVRFVLLVVAILGLLAAQAVATVPGGGSASADGTPQRDGPNVDRAVVLLTGEPTAATGAAHGPRAEQHRAQLAAERANFHAWMARNVPQARVHAEFDTVLNAVSITLNGADRNALRSGPGVQDVLTPTWMSPTMNASLELIGWDDAFGVATSGAGVPEGVTVGAGVFVGVIDSGIDQGHDFFRVDDSNRSVYEDTEGCLYSVTDTAGHAAPNEPDFTTCKVIVARTYPPDSEFTAEDVNGHGTHVAGTVAGTSGTDSPTGLLSGVAPGAVLGNYNVFPGDTGSASSDDIALAVEDAVLDGADVLNLSLGGTPERTFDVLDLALLSAAQTGVIAAVAAGNSGPGAGTVESPGWSPWVLTAGATTNAHFLGQSVEHDALVGGSTGAAVGDFDPFPVDTPMTAPYVWWDDIDARNGTGEACENRPLRGVDLTGQIALIMRGSCTFTTKIRNAENLNAAGVIVFNNAAGDPIAMGHDGTDPFPTIPAVMVSQDAGEVLVDAAPREVTAGGPIEPQVGSPDFMAPFSSRGPIATPDGTIIKPDMTAPGVNINSSIPCSHTEDPDDCSFALFQGTSMASPHLAGAAAALIAELDLGDKSEARVRMVKSLLVNHADRFVVLNHTGLPTAGVNDQGAGRLDLDATVDAMAWADPVSVSFGVEPMALSVSRTVHLHGLPSGAVTFQATGTHQATTVAATVDADGVLTVVATRGARSIRGQFQGHLRVLVDEGAGPAEVMHLPYWGQWGR